MTFEIALVLTILMGAIVIFLTEKFNPDIVSMLVLVTLVLTGLVTVEDAFSGFANPAVVTVGAIFVVSDGLFRTGVADFIGQHILRIARANEARLIAVIMITAGVLSAFMNNIGATAVLMPVVISLARETRVSATKLLIPLAFASSMGGNLTLIGTPPNILASSALREYTGAGYQFFDFFPMGILILIFGVLYMVFIGRYLLPDRRNELTANYHVREYLSEVRVLANSPLVGKTILESQFGTKYDLTIVGIIRNEETRPITSRQDQIYPNDMLLVKGSLDKLLRVRRTQGIQIEAEAKHTHDSDLKSGAGTIAEAILGPNSNIAGRNLKDIRFREKYRMTVLALWRRGQTIQGSLADEPLHHGDVLLVQGHRKSLNLLRTSPHFLLLEPLPLEMRRVNKAPVALAIMAGLLLMVTSGLLHVSIAGVMAAILMVMLGVLSIEEAYRSIDWHSMFLIAGMLPLGLAMETTGAAEFLARVIVDWMAPYGPIAIISGIYILTALMTQPMSNAATTVLMAPIAINVAIDMGADVRSVLMVVVIAASTSFLTPLAHQSNILVFGPGGYRFTDYTKVGLGLNVMYLLLVAFVLPFVWPLFPG